MSFNMSFPPGHILQRFPESPGSPRTGSLIVRWWAAAEMQPQAWEELAGLSRKSEPLVAAGVETRPPGRQE